MKKNLGLFLAIILVQIAPFISAADTLHPLIYKIDIKKEISNTTRLYLSNGLAEAYALGADAVLIHMNTYRLDAYGYFVQPHPCLCLHRQQCGFCWGAHFHRM